MTPTTPPAGSLESAPTMPDQASRAAACDVTRFVQTHFGVTAIVYEETLAMQATIADLIERHISERIEQLQGDLASKSAQWSCAQLAAEHLGLRTETAEARVAALSRRIDELTALLRQRNDEKADGDPRLAHPPQHVEELATAPVDTDGHLVAGTAERANGTEATLPAEAPLTVRDTVEFDPFYGADYLRMGWRFGRIEGHHHYDQVVYDLRKLELVGERYCPTGVLIYMVPAWAVQRAPLQEFVAPQEIPDGQAQA